MQTLEATLKRFARGSGARWWVGQRPEARASHMAETIAAQIGLPTSMVNPFDDGDMVSLDRTQAAYVLAVAATTSLAYGQPKPKRGALQDAAMALADLNENAVFCSNGRWEAGVSQSWSPLTSATFDCGVIGFDDQQAFIFWIEEED